MSIVTGKRRGPFGQALVLVPIFGLVLLVGCSTFEANPSPNPAQVSTQDLKSQPYPNLSQVPDKPPPVTPEQIRASTAAGLEADRANAQYTATLTASGTSVQSANPPNPTPTTTAAASSSASAPSAAAATAAAPAASVGAAVTGGTPTSLEQTTTAVAAVGVPNSATGRTTIPSGTAPQAESPYSGGAVAAGATTSGAGTSTSASVPTGAAGSPSASQTPGARALASSRRQRRSGATPTTVATVPVVSSQSSAPQPVTTAALPAQTQQPHGASLGGAAAAAAALPLVPQQGTVGTGAVQLVAIMYFANGSAALDGRDRAVLREVAAIQRQYGGILRVVGHASSRTAVLPQERHKLVNLEVSFDRAESVGQALLRAGLPSPALVLEGVSDRHPVYHEFMVTGEAGNRRAEIYLEY